MVHSWIFERHGRPLLLLAIVSLLLLLPGLGRTPLYSKGEPREALVARAILDTGDWVLPARYGDEFASKPPLAHWLMAAASIPAGEVNEWTVRLPQALASFLVVIGLYLFVAARRSREHGLLSALILLGSFEWFRASVSCRVDMILAAALFAAFAGLVRWDERSLRGVPWLALLGTSAAVLAKGPVAVILVTGSCFLYLLARGAAPIRAALKTALVGLGALPIPAIWYLLAYRSGGDAFLQTVLDENFRRFTGSLHGDETPHSHSMLYLYGSLLTGFIPWTLLAPLLRIRLTPFRTIAARLRALPALELFSVVVCFTVLAFYSLPESKRSVYLLPLYPFLSFLVAKGLLAVWKDRPAGLCRYAIGFACFVPILLAAVLGLTCEIEAAAPICDAVKLLSAWELAAAAIPIGIAIAALIERRGDRTRLVLGSLGSYFALLWFAHLALIPRFIDTVSPLPFAETIRPLVPRDAVVYAYGDDFYPIAYYLGNRAGHFSFDLKGITLPAYVLIYESFLPEFDRKKPIELGYRIEARSPNPISKPGQTVVLIKVNRIEQQ